MKVLISGGGTAGHINPAIAIGKQLQKRGDQVLYIGSDGLLEQKLYSATGSKYLQFPSKGLDRKHLFKNAGILVTDCKAYRGIGKAVAEFAPDAGVSTGGYISALAMLALKTRGIPFLIHEQNAFPGLTNRLLSRWAKKSAVAFTDAVPYLKHQDRAVLTGNPIRSELTNINKSLARQQLGIPAQEKVILCFGGSLGAQKLNEAFAGLIPLALAEHITMIIGTGSRYHEAFQNSVQHTPVPSEKIRIHPYIDDMPTVLAACDLAITRAGAMTVSELCAMKKPAILIPSPNVTANHQDKNAEAMVRSGGAVKIPESALTPDALHQAVHRLFETPHTLAQMEQKLAPLSITDADERIANLVSEITRKQ